MLDTIRQLIAEALEISTAEVNDFRKDLLAEQATADARYAASSALIHPEGSTTPINEAYFRAQQRVAKLRQAAEATLPAALKALMALEIATQLRDEADAHRRLKWDQEWAKDTLGVDPAVADYWARLYQHGVRPHYLKQQAAETVAVIGDLITWKAGDPKFKDPANPWRDVLGLYAHRRIEKPHGLSKAKRSIVGTPARDRHFRDDESRGDYMFNEKFAELPPLRQAQPPSAPTPASDPEPVAPPEALASEAVAAPRVGAVPEPSDSAIGDPSRQAEPVTDPVPVVAPHQAAQIAQAYYARTPSDVRIYWPIGWIDFDDFDPGRLVPALEAMAEGDNGWSGADHFLDMARAGRAREFILELRRKKAGDLADALMCGDVNALAKVRAAKLL